MSDRILGRSNSCKLFSLRKCHPAVRIVRCVVRIKVNQSIPGRPKLQLQLTSIFMSRHAQPAPLCAYAQPEHGPARLYMSQPLLSDECPLTCSTNNLALAGCASYGNKIRPNVTFCRSHIEIFSSIRLLTRHVRL